MNCFGNKMSAEVTNIRSIDAVVLGDSDLNQECEMDNQPRGIKRLLADMCGDIDYSQSVSKVRRCLESDEKLANITTSYNALIGTMRNKESIGKSIVERDLVIWGDMRNSMKSDVIDWIGTVVMKEYPLRATRGYKHEDILMDRYTGTKLIHPTETSINCINMINGTPFLVSDYTKNEDSINTQWSGFNNMYGVAKNELSIQSCLYMFAIMETSSRYKLDKCEIIEYVRQYLENINKPETDSADEYVTTLADQIFRRYCNNISDSIMEGVQVAELQVAIDRFVDYATVFNCIPYINIPTRRVNLEGPNDACFYHEPIRCIPNFNEVIILSTNDGDLHCYDIRNLRENESVMRMEFDSHTLHEGIDRATSITIEKFDNVCKTGYFNGLLSEEIDFSNMWINYKQNAVPRPYIITDHRTQPQGESSMESELEDLQNFITNDVDKDTPADKEYRQRLRNLAKYAIDDDKYFGTKKGGSDKSGNKTNVVHDQILLDKKRALAERKIELERLKQEGQRAREIQKFQYANRAAQSKIDLMNLKEYEAFRRAQSKLDKDTNDLIKEQTDTMLDEIRKKREELAKTKPEMAQKILDKLTNDITPGFVNQHAQIIAAKNQFMKKVDEDSSLNTLLDIDALSELLTATQQDANNLNHVSKMLSNLTSGLATYSSQSGVIVQDNVDQYLLAALENKVLEIMNKQSAILKENVDATITRTERIYDDLVTKLTDIETIHLNPALLVDQAQHEINVHGLIAQTDNDGISEGLLDGDIVNTGNKTMLVTSGGKTYASLVNAIAEKNRGMVATMKDLSSNMQRETANNCRLKEKIATIEATSDMYKKMYNDSKIVERSLNSAMKKEIDSKIENTKKIERVLKDVISMGEKLYKQNAEKTKSIDKTFNLMQDLFTQSGTMCEDLQTQLADMNIKNADIHAYSVRSVKDFSESQSTRLEIMQSALNTFQQESATMNKQVSDRLLQHRELKNQITESNAHEVMDTLFTKSLPSMNDNSLQGNMPGPSGVAYNLATNGANATGTTAGPSGATNPVATATTTGGTQTKSNVDTMTETLAEIKKREQGLQRRHKRELNRVIGCTVDLLNDKVSMLKKMDSVQVRIRDGVSNSTTRFKHVTWEPRIIDLGDKSYCKGDMRTNIDHNTIEIARTDLECKWKSLVERVFPVTKVITTNGITILKRSRVNAINTYILPCLRLLFGKCNVSANGNYVVCSSDSATVVKAEDVEGRMMVEAMFKAKNVYDEVKHAVMAHTHEDSTCIQNTNDGSESDHYTSDDESTNRRWYS